MYVAALLNGAVLAVAGAAARPFQAQALQLEAYDTAASGAERPAARSSSSELLRGYAEEEEEPRHFEPVLDGWPADRTVAGSLLASQEGLAAFVWRAAIIATIGVALFALYSREYKRFENWTGIRPQHLSCLAFVCLSVSIDISIKAAALANGGQYAFDPAVAVLVVEALKLVASLAIFSCVAVQRRLRKEPMEWPSALDAAWLALPGLIYTVDMVVVFETIQHVSLASYGVVRETRLIWAAVIWMAIFRIPVSFRRWLGILGILVGCAVSQLPLLLGDHHHARGVWLAFLLAFLTGSAGVINEYTLKRRMAVDINLQNSLHYFAGTCCVLIYLALFKTEIFRAGGGGFFRGFGPHCLQVIVLQVFAGLTVSRILKYLEAVTEKVLGSFCSPAVIFVGAAMTRTHLRGNEIAAPIVVFCSCLVYFSEGALSRAGLAEGSSGQPTEGSAKAQAEGRLGGTWSKA